MFYHYTNQKYTQKTPNFKTYFNRQSTDPNQGYACYNGKTAMAYFNRSDFAAAFNIDKEFYTGGGVFQDCKWVFITMGACWYKKKATIFLIPNTYM